MKYKITSAGTIEDNWPFQVHDYVEVFFSKFLPDVPVLNNNTVLDLNWCEIHHIEFGQIIRLPDTRVAVLDIESGKIPTNETFRNVESLVNALNLKHITSPFKIQPQIGQKTTKRQ